MIGISVFALAYSITTANAFQPDASFVAYQEKNKDKWAQKDKIMPHSNLTGCEIMLPTRGSFGGNHSRCAVEVGG